MKADGLLLIAAVQNAGIPALRVAFSAAAMIFVGAGALIWRKRHELFDSDATVDNDIPVVRHNRAEEILFVWGGLTLVMLFIVYELWSVWHEVSNNIQDLSGGLMSILSRPSFLGTVAAAAGGLTAFQQLKAATGSLTDPG